jgi:hypothetical protein
MNRFEEEYTKLWSRELGKKVSSKHFGFWTNGYVEWLQSELLWAREDIEKLKKEKEPK